MVVGTGPASCALVARLASHKIDGESAKILVLEAGPDLRDEPSARTPSRWAEVWGGAGKYLHNVADWGFETYLKQHKRWEGVARGRTIGGSSTVNAQMWVLGDPKDWDSLSIPGWTWKTIQPLFEWLDSKFETRTVSKKNAVLSAAMKSWKGLDVVSDHQEAILSNSVKSPISGNRQNNSIEERLNPFSVLVEPLLVSGNVRVVDSATVERIVLSEALVATGVVFSVPDSGSYFVGATSEVILCAGAFASPQILMLSGIGPRKELLKHKIATRVELPVGEQLMDHCFCMTVAFLKDVPEKSDGSFLDCTGFYKSDYSIENEPTRGRDMQIVNYITPPAGMFLGKAASDIVALVLPAAPRNSFRGKVHTFLTRILAAFFEKTHILDAKMKRVMVASIVVNHPKSRGSLKLNSANPHDSPIIDLGLLNAPEDVDRLLDALKRQLVFWKTEPIASKVASFDPKTTLLFEASDEDLIKHIKKVRFFVNSCE